MIILLIMNIIFGNNNLFSNALNCDVKQVHIAQGISPTSMMISWVTEEICESNVIYDTNNKNLTKYSYGEVSYYNYTYSINKNNSEFYQSGYIHHSKIENLLSSTKYYYKCGDFLNVYSELFDFTTLPKIGDNAQITFGIIGDLGQTKYSMSTLKHLFYDNKIQMVLNAGDLSYADCNQILWDSYGALIEQVSKKKAWMVCAGNHEIEYNGIDYSKLYTSFENRYKMPAVKEAEYGEIIIPSKINPNTNLPFCTPSVFQSEYNYGNSFYSFESGLTYDDLKNNIDKVITEIPKEKYENIIK